MILFAKLGRVEGTTFAEGPGSDSVVVLDGRFGSANRHRIVEHEVRKLLRVKPGRFNAYQLFKGETILAAKPHGGVIRLDEAACARAPGDGPEIIKVREVQSRATHPWFYAVHFSKQKETFPDDTYGYFTGTTRKELAEVIREAVEFYGLPQRITAQAKLLEYWPAIKRGIDRGQRGLDLFIRHARGELHIQALSQIEFESTTSPPQA